jgi:hypothetical protein
MPYILALLCALAFASSATPALADKRVALVIGNSAYQNTAELVNPSNDAADITGALTRLGFQVIEGRDLDKRAMERMIRQFGLALAGSDVALFFYAGHGLQVGGQNYLVPTDAKLASEGDVDFETLPLHLVLKQMEREAKTSVVLLDACRDNPLAKNLARSMGTRAVGIGSGLAEVKTGVGTLIGFSTQPGNVAGDGSGRNSPYAGALLKNIELPGKDLSAILVAVRNEVLQATNGSQVPWEHTSLTGQVFFIPDPSTPAPATTAPGLNYDKEMEIALWNAVKDSKSPAVLQSYLDRFPNGTFAGLARVLVEQLRAGEQKGSPKGSPKMASAPPPDQPKAADPPATDPQALARALQTELRRVGCDPGSIDGKWGPNAVDALGDFARRAKVKLATAEPSQDALQAVASQKGRICPLECDRGEKEVNGKCVATAKPERPKRHVAEKPVRRGGGSGSGSAERDEKPSKQGTCWKQDGRNFTVGPC